MGMIDRRIIQTREYHNPQAEEPKLNYSETFPVTVFEAVRESMNDSTSATLKEVLDDIKRDLAAKQPLLEARTADHLVTYSGVPGGTGAIQISHKIPWDQTKQSHDRIPTEKAVGEVLFTLGLIDEEGKPINDPESKHVRWSDVIGRPNVYIGLGNAEDGFITQKGVTENIVNLDNRIAELADEYHSDTRFDQATTDLENHATNHNNPHDVTIYQLDGVPMDIFKQHAAATNPHKLNRVDIGLGRVDNTSDLEKPISEATQRALDRLTLGLDGIRVNLREIEFVDLVEYDQDSGRLKIEFNTGRVEYCNIPIDGLLDEAYYNNETKQVTLVELSGHKTILDLSDLTDIYTGKSTSELSVEVKNFSIGVSLKTNGVDGSKLKDLSVVTNKLGERSVTSAKIGVQEVKQVNIKDRAVTGSKLFTSEETGVMAVVEPETDPVYTKVSEDLIGDDAVTTRTILDRNVTTAKIANNAVTHIKLAANSVDTDNIMYKSVTSEKLANSLILGGNPRIANRPQSNLFNDLIPDTKWVQTYVQNEIFDNKNLADRSVDGRNLFTSYDRNRVLTVRGAGTNPQWGTINEEMMGNLSVDTRSLIDYSVTTEKLATRSVITNKIENAAVTTSKIADRAVTPEKLAVSLHSNVVLGTSAFGEPLYTKIQEGMFERDSIRGVDVQDNTLPPSKIQTTDQADMLVGIYNRGTTVGYVKINSGMFNKGVVDGYALFRSPVKNRVLVSEEAEEEPYWGQINTEMIRARAISREKIQIHAVDHDLLEVDSVDTINIRNGAVTERTIADGSISPSKFKTSPYPNKILAVLQQYSDPTWSSITTDMIEDEAITSSKLMRSQHANRVLAATSKDAPPEYTQVTGDMITDHSIGPRELEFDMVFYGTPSLTVHPEITSADYHIPSTKWVNDKITNRLAKISYDDISGLDWQLYEKIRETLNDYTFSGGDVIVGGGDSVPNISDERLKELVDSALSDVKFQLGASYDPCMTLPAIDDERLSYLVNQAVGEFQKELDLKLKCECEPVNYDTITEKVWDTVELVNLYKEIEDGVEVVEDSCPEWMNLDLPSISYEICEELVEYGKTVEGRLNREILLTRKYGDAVSCPGGVHGEISYDRAKELMSIVMSYYSYENGPNMLLQWADLIASEDKNICSIYGTCQLPYFPYERAIELVENTKYFVFRDKVTGYHDWIANNIDIYELIRGGLTIQSSVLRKYSVTNEYIASYSVDGRTMFRPGLPNQVLLVDTGGTDPKWGKVEGRHIANGAITSENIALYGINDQNINVDAVRSHHIQNYNITAPKMATGSITPRALADASVTYEKIAAESVQTYHIADHAVTGGKIKKRTIVNENIAIGTISTDLIRDLNITTDKINNWAVTTDKIGQLAVTTNKIAEASVTTSKLRDGCVTAEKIQENGIQSMNLAYGSVTASAIADGSVHSFHLASDFSFDAKHIGDNTITGNKIASNEIESRHLEKNLSFKGETTVESGGYLNHKQLRNVVIMNRPPTEYDTDFEDGDIWLYYN